MQGRHASRSEPDELTVERASLFRSPPVPTPRTGTPPAPALRKGPVLPPTPTTAPLPPPTPATVVESSSENGEVLGRVLVGVRGQEQIPLERPVVFGRRPASTRRSGVDPLLVTVPSPGQEISASHVRIEPAGQVVVVTDLKSRNGTRVSLDGRRARRLRPGESFAVPGHAAVEIGDGTIIDITPVGLIS